MSRSVRDFFIMGKYMFTSQLMAPANFWELVVRIRLIFFAELVDVEFWTLRNVGYHSECPSESQRCIVSYGTASEGVSANPVFVLVTGEGRRSAFFSSWGIARMATTSSVD